MGSRIKVEFSELAISALKNRLSKSLTQALTSWLTVTLRQRPWQFGGAYPEELGGNFRVGVVDLGHRIRVRVWYEIRDDTSVMIWSLAVHNGSTVYPPRE
jgi:hypothetical protein